MGFFSTISSAAKGLFRSPKKTLNELTGVDSVYNFVNNPQAQSQFISNAASIQKAGNTMKNLVIGTTAGVISGGLASGAIGEGAKGGAALAKFKSWGGLAKVKNALGQTGIISGALGQLAKKQNRGETSVYDDSFQPTIPTPPKEPIKKEVLIIGGLAILAALLLTNKKKK